VFRVGRASLPTFETLVLYATLSNLSLGKGVSVLLEALRILDRRGIPVDVRIYGRGLLHDECVAVARQLNRGVTLTMGGLLDYGEAFFEMLRDHDLLVAPSVSDEQPRIIYDCFSQALPVIASDTPGLRQCFSDMPDQNCPAISRIDSTS
jgi:glycosyltransferase involved in cell wall biosynthesis